MTRNQILNFLNSSKVRELNSAPWYFGVDNNQLKAEEWEKRDLRILVGFLSPGRTRAVSNSYVALDRLIRSASDNVFVDYAYFPPKIDLEKIHKYGLPYWVGNISHAPMDDYDVVMISTSILCEFLNVYHILEQSRFSLLHEERLQDPEAPLFMIGGIPVADSDNLAPVIDLVYVGFGEGRLPEVVRELEFLKTDGGIKERKSRVITKLVTKFDNMYYPAGYKVDYKGAEITSIKPRYSFVPEEVQFHREKDLNRVTGFERKIFNPDNESAAGADILISHGCSGGCCHFCAEGWACGGWQEKSLDNIIESMEETIRHAAPNSATFYSFNINYHSRFLDLVYETVRRFAGTSFRNMRMDVVGADTQILKIGNQVGLAKISLPIEGLGERIRNTVLNKSLPFSLIKKAYREALKCRAMQIKMGYILTGHETAEDVREGVEELEELLRIREEMNAGTALQINFTPLIHYPHTGCAWLEQNTSKISLKKVKTLSSVMEKFRGKIRIKVNAQNYGTFFEQMALNLGRLGVPIWHKLAREGFFYYAAPGKGPIDIMMTELARMGLLVEDFLKAKPFDWIFPTQMIGGKSEKYKRKVYDSIGKQPLQYCLKTPANLKPQCHDCGYCTTKDEKKQMLKRELKSSKTLEDIQEALFSNKAMSAYRVAYRLSKRHDLKGKETLSHYVASKILQRHKLWKEFHSVKNVSNKMMLGGSLEDWAHGTFFFDLRLKKRVAPGTWNWDTVCRQVNEMTVADIFSIKEVNVNAKLSRQALVLSVLEIKGTPFEDLARGIRNYKKKVKFPTKGLGGMYSPALDWKNLEGTRTFHFAGASGVKMGCLLPLWVHPVLFLASVMDWGYKKARANSYLKIVGYFKGSGGICECGGERMVSLATMETSKWCLSCLAKRSLRV